MMAGGRLMRMEKQSMPDRGMEGRRRGIESERCVFCVCVREREGEGGEEGYSRLGLYLSI